MELYLAIITTVLVLTQIIRLVQNTISLRLQRRDVYRHLADLDKMQPTVEDFRKQKEVISMLYYKLKAEEPNTLEVMYFDEEECE